MPRCPNCDAHRKADDDYCPVCGETLPGPHLSEATGPRWYERTRLLAALVLLLWPLALYGLYQRDDWDQNPDQWLLGGCLLAAVGWMLLFRLR